MASEKRSDKGLIRWTDFEGWPFVPERAYWVLGFEEVGNHAATVHGTVLFALSGELRVVCDDGRGHEKRVFLTNDGEGLYIPAGWWRTVDTMARIGTASVLAFSSGPYNEKWQIRDRGEFERWAMKMSG